jgi:long-chain acyl-CoA synthetase
MDSLSALLASRARQAPADVAIEIEGADPLTWRDLDERASAVAARLRGLGLIAGQTVLVAARRDIVPVAVHGALRAGGVVLPVETSTPAEALAMHARRGRAAWALADPAVAAALDAPVVDPVAADLVAARIADQAPVAVPDLAMVILTSGSTGQPRGVMLTQANVLAAARRMAAVRGHGPGDRHLCFLSYAHYAEPFMSCWLHVVAGYRVVVTATRHLLDALRVARPTFLMAVPSEWQAMREALPGTGGAAEQRSALGIERVRLAMSTGAALAPELHDAFAELGLPICEMYGMTESSGAATYNPPEARRPGSVGRALPGSRVDIDADGEICIAGPAFQSPGYLDDPEETALTFEGGRIRTGDLGRLDGDGYLFLAGRKKELIVLSTGKKVHPGALEARLAALPGVRHAAVFGEGAAFLVALLDVDPAREGEVGAALARLNERLPRHERIRAHRRVAPFSVEGGELTASLKVRRAALAHRYAEELAQLVRVGDR